MQSKIILNEGRDKSLLRKHPWIFSKAIKDTILPPVNGGDIEVYDANNKFLAIASYSPNSQIRARVWSFEKETTIDKEFFKKAIDRAYQSRLLMLEKTGMNACRLIDAESDFLPGLIIDMYDNYLVLEVLSAGAEYHLKDITSALRELFPHIIFTNVQM